MVHDYLGILITKDPVTESIHMSKPGLMKSIVNNLGLFKGSKTEATPSQGILHADHEGALQ
jgi:hypothetical protein